VLSSVDGPTGVVLVPVAATLWWKRNNGWARTLCLVLIPGAIVQFATIVAANAQRSTLPNGPSLTSFIHILSRQVFLSSVLGFKAELHIFRKVPFAVEAVIALVGLSSLVYAVWRGPIQLKLFVLFVGVVLAAALVNPLAAVTGSQWEVLAEPGAGNRYFFLPTIACLATLLWIATSSRRPMSTAAAMILLLSLVGIRGDWRHFPFADLHFRAYAHAFEQAPVGTHVTIPINPSGWSMELTKH